MPPSRQPDTPFHFEGFSSPNVTPVPDDFFDLLAPRLAEGELRLLLYMVRRIFGFKKDGDAISFSQMMNGIRKRDGTILDYGTGMSKSAVWRAVNGLSAKGVIEAEKRQTAEGDADTTVYHLRFRNGGGVVLQKNHGGSPKEHGVVLQKNQQHDRSQHDSKQQQPPGPSTTPVDASASARTVVVASLKLPQDQESEASPLITRLMDLGVSKDAARQLAGDYPAEAIEQQLTVLPFRPNIQDPAATLVAAVKGSWAAPEAYRKHIKKAERQLDQDAKKAAVTAAAAATQQEEAARARQVTEYLDGLGPAERAAIEAEVTRKIQGLWPTAPPAKEGPMFRAFLHQVAAERLGLNPEV